MGLEPPQCILAAASGRHPRRVDQAQASKHAAMCDPRSDARHAGRSAALWRGMTRHAQHLWITPSKGRSRQPAPSLSGTPR